MEVRDGEEEDSEGRVPAAVVAALPGSATLRMPLWEEIFLHNTIVLRIA